MGLLQAVMWDLMGLRVALLGQGQVLEVERCFKERGVFQAGRGDQDEMWMEGWIRILPTSIPGHVLFYVLFFSVISLTWCHDGKAGSMLIPTSRGLFLTCTHIRTLLRPLPWKWAS